MYSFVIRILCLTDAYSDASHVEDALREVAKVLIAGARWSV